MKRDLPAFLTAAAGTVMVASFFVPHELVSVPADFLQTCAVVVVAFGFVLGAANVLRVNVDAVARREEHWPYKAVLVVSLVATVIAGAVEGARNQGGFLDPGTVSCWAYDHVFSPTGATMSALLAFFIASAAFRALRLRSWQAWVFAAVALIVILGRAPIGETALGWLPAWLRPGAVTHWIMDVPQNAARRAILIGVALGVMATGLRLMLGLERPHLDAES